MLAQPAQLLAALRRAATAITLRRTAVSVAELEMPADRLDLRRAKAIYNEHGCLIVRGLNKAYVADIRQHCEDALVQSIKLLPQATELKNIGWVTPDGTLFIPAPPGAPRDKQAMVLSAVDYYTSSAMFRAASDPRTLDVVEALVGPNIELFSKGQVFFKEGGYGKSGSNPKYMHQDGAYFEFKKHSLCATLNYTIETSVALDNGPLYVVPGSHKRGYIPHIDTPSHLGLPPSREFSFEAALPVDGAAGDAIFFHIHLVHGSPPNRSNTSRATFINRYLAADDFQLLQATDVAMREAAARRAKEDERAVKRQKQRGFILRGRRPFDPDFDYDVTSGVHH